MKRTRNVRMIKIGICLLSCCILMSFTKLVSAQPRVVTDEVSISQQRLFLQGEANGGYSLSRVLGSGAQFFMTPFVPADGMGEGVSGPRKNQRAAFYPQVENFPVLKMNGIGSQSCVECHNSIGSFKVPTSDGSILLRKESAVGGAGGLASNLFQNSKFPGQIVDFYRNPPHMFGSGYTQRLAAEITYDIQLAKEAARMAAELNPGVEQSISLDSKGITYGTFKTTYTAPTDSGSGTFQDDLSEVTGVPSDLVLRPFQHKGIASSLRHFVTGALGFHFSIQPIEVVGYNVDADQDGKYNEMTPNLELGPDSDTPEEESATDISAGNVSALTAWVGMVRAPVTQIEEGMEDSVARGEALFLGTGISDLPVEAAGMCASCHVPSLQIELPVFTIDSPIHPVDTSHRAGAGLGDSAVPDSDSLPVVKAFKDILKDYKDHPFVQDALSNPNNSAADFHALLLQVQDDLNQDFLPSGYHIDLTLPGTRNGNTPDEVPSFVFPRLAANPGKGVLKKKRSFQTPGNTHGRVCGKSWNLRRQHTRRKNK